MVKSNLRLVTPDSDLRTVTLHRRSNRDMGRDREHLTELEVERLIKVARGNRWGQRDAAMILVGFRHGLRVSELCDLQWSSIAFETGTMYVHRAKGGDQGQQFARLWLCKASRESIGACPISVPARSNCGWSSPRVAGFSGVDFIL